MPTGKTCGNCANFVRIHGWGNGRNGLCGKYDYNCRTDSSYAKRCKGYASKKYNRKQEDITCKSHIKEM